jgi:hypothetical protein
MAEVSQSELQLGLRGACSDGRLGSCDDQGWVALTEMLLGRVSGLLRPEPIPACQLATSSRGE